MKRILAVFGALAVGAALVIAAAGSQAADHLESTLVMRDGRTDINDMYVFRGATPGRAALVMTVNPDAGSTSGTTFRQGARYLFEVDNNGDAHTDHRYRVMFGAVRESDGSQAVQVY